MRRDTAGLASSRTLSELGDWGECGVNPVCFRGCHVVCRVLKAAAAMPFVSTAAMLRSILLLPALRRDRRLWR